MQRLAWVLGLALLAMAAACKPAPPRNEAPVVIVGGGLAGLVTAYELQRYNIRAHVLEERPVWGGRVATAHYPSGAQGEYGMQEVWQDNPLLRVIQDLGVPTDPASESAFSSTLLDGKIQAFTQPTLDAHLASVFTPAEVQALRAFMASAERLYKRARGPGLKDPEVAALQELSLAGWLQKAQLPPRVAQWLALTIECELASEADGVSALSALLDMEMFLGQGLANYHVQGGNSAIIDALVKKIQGPMSLGAQVNGITRSMAHGKPQLTVTYEQDHQVRTLQAEHVVLAVPFVRLHQINIEPSLPADYWSALNSMHLGQYTVVHLLTDAKARGLWQHDKASPFPLLAGGPLGVVYGPAHAAPNATQDVFGLLIYGRAARAFHMVPREAKVHEIQDALEAYWPGLKAQTRGSYVYSYHPTSLPVWPPGRSPLDRLSQQLRTPHMGLHLAGDYTRGAHATAAVQSGIEVAAEISAAMETK